MKIYAHRGYSARYPEGTRAAYEGAVFARADGFECDVRLTRDGEIICFHDRTIKRIAGIRKAISRLKSDELKGLVNAITLKELLEIAITERKDLLIETKHPVSSRGKIEKKVITLIEKHQKEINRAGIRVTVMSFSYLAVRRLKRIYPDVVKVIKYSLPARLTHQNAIAINIELLKNKKIDIRKIKAERVLVWTVNSSEAMKVVKDLNIEGVITDKPHYARKKLIG